MLCEVLNALVITFAATEFINSTADDAHSSSSSKRRSDNYRGVIVLGNILVSSPLLMILLIFTAVVNIISRFGSTTIGKDVASTFKDAALHHRFALAATSFVIVLGLDCYRLCRNRDNINTIDQITTFMKRLGISTLQVIPIYPMLAVIIAFCFVFLIDALNALNIPFQWLNDPLYYGILYGPFSYIYWDVKRKYVNIVRGLPT